MPLTLMIFVVLSARSDRAVGPSTSALLIGKTTTPPRVQVNGRRADNVDLRYCGYTRWMIGKASRSSLLQLEPDATYASDKKDQPPTA